MSVLRDSALTPQISAGFEERVVRLVKVQTKRESLVYWTPAMIGGAIACVALFAVLQIAAAPVRLKEANLPAGEVRLNKDFDEPTPRLILERKPHFDQ